MDKNINIEAFNFAINKLQTDMFVKGNTPELIKEYSELKSAYKMLRIKDEYNYSECLKALIIFKEHLILNIDKYYIFKDLINKKIDRINNQMNKLKDNLKI